MSAYERTRQCIISICYMAGGSYHSLVTPMAVMPIIVNTTITKFILLVAIEKVLSAIAINTTALAVR